MPLNLLVSRKKSRGSGFDPIFYQSRGLAVISQGQDTKPQHAWSSTTMETGCLPFDDRNNFTVGDPFSSSFVPVQRRKGRLRSCLLSLGFPRWCGWGVETSMPGRSKVTCYCCCSASCSSSRNFFRIFAFLTRNWIRTNRFFPSFSSHSPGLAPDWRERGKALGIAAFVSSNGWIRPGRPSFIIVQLEREKSHPFQKSQRNGRLQYQKLRRHDLKMGRVGAPIALTILVNRSRPAAMNTLCRLCEGSLNKNQEKRPPKEIKLIHLYPIG
ncbi:unnamed protein product [Vicia faba]|uniref:Uncharacterized protein n=1 Tax=Vicia faba TaxID=3906 RepID=A0AAV1AG74_VICFA|nr:unnamed protein product [Vicia faba]